MNPNCGGSNIDSPDWIKTKKAAINLINKRDKTCFQYTVTVVLNYEEIKKDPQRIKKIRPFINKYYWERIDFPSVVLFWSKKLSALLRGIPSKHYGDFYCLHSFNAKNKFDSHKRVCKK